MGLASGFIPAWMKAWATAWLLAFTVVLPVAPLARRMVRPLLKAD